MKFNLQFFAEEGEVVESTPTEPTEPTGDTVDSEVEDSQPDTEEEATPDYSDFLAAVNGKAVYKGEPMNIESFDDVIARIQKSENYDPVYERMTKAESRIKEIENSRQTKFMNKFLKDNGFDTFEAYEDALEVHKLVQEGMSEDKAKRYVENERIRAQKEEADNAKRLEEDKTNLQSEKNFEAIQWYKEKGYGDLTADKITEQTWKKVQEGLPLKYAIMEQMFDHVKGDTEQTVLKKLKEKQQTSMPKLSGNGEEQVKSIWDMTDAEFEKLRNDPKAKAKRFK